MSYVDSRAIGPDNAVTDGFNTSLSSTISNGISQSPLDVYTDPGDWRFFGFSIGIIVAVLGTGGNGLTLWAYNNNRNLQTSFNLLITNLCCLELIFSFIIIPLQLPGYILKTSPYPKAVCTTIGYFYYSLIAASLHNLVAIAINRYVGILNTKRYQKMFTGKRLRLWVLSIWLTSPILYLPLAIGGSIDWRENSLRCAITFPENSATRIGNVNILKIYNTVLNVIYQAGGLLSLVVLYSSIIYRVNNVKKKMKLHRQASLLRPGDSKYKSSVKGESRSKVPTSGTTSAATSGDEDIDDYKPSSIISGGFHFRPGKGRRKHKSGSDSGHGSDHESGSHLQKPLSSVSHSLASHATISDEPAQNPKGRRPSLWQVFFRSKAKKELEEHDEYTPDCTTDEESKRDDTKEDEESPDKAKETPDETDPLQEVKIVMRNTDEKRKDMRRKKSLSAPTIPSLEDIMRSPRKRSVPLVQHIPENVTEVDETGSIEASPRPRAFTVTSKYIKHHQRGTHDSNVWQDAEHVQHLPPVDVIKKLCHEDKEACTSLPTLPAANAEIPNHPRFGTIARRIKDQKNKRDRRQKARKRDKSIRKRQARERQLVYSSLTICIAFAVCILPTSLLSVSQTIFKFKAQAAVVLVVSCISWLHSIVNPFIYGYMNNLYRKEYGHIAKQIKMKLTACLK